MMNADKYIDRNEAIAEFKVLYTQLGKLIIAIDDNEVRWDAILCLQKVIEVQYRLQTDMAASRHDVHVVASQAKSLIKQYGSLA